MSVDQNGDYGNRKWKTREKQETMHEKTIKWTVNECVTQGK